MTAVERERSRSSGLVTVAPSPEALIEEARQRQRRRRRRIVAICLLGIVAGTAGFSVARLKSDGASKTTHSSGSGPFVDRAAFAGHGKLAFVSLGALYVLDGKSQQLRRVTTRDSDVANPHFSPNGRWLTYTLGNDNVGVAGADGSAPRTILAASSGDQGGRWLPNSELLVGRRIYRISGGGKPMRVGSVPVSLAAWSPSGNRYVFVVRKLSYGKSGSFKGVEKLEVSRSLDGRRTTWVSDPISFNRSSGFDGDAINGVVVLPNREGVLYWLDPDQSASLAADGMALNLIRRPGGRPVKLGVTVGDTISVGTGGTIAIGGGGNRYAWLTKNVRVCAVASASCHGLGTRAGSLTIDPAWSPDGQTLAFVEAATEPSAAAFTQPVVSHWYSTHNLWLLRQGSKQPVEVPGTRGAAAPVWSQNSSSVLFVADDALWLIPSLGAKPAKIAAPFFPPTAWPNYYGQIAWANEFSWQS